MGLTSGDYSFGAETGVVRLRTTRQGFAAAAGHDLLIEVTRWTGSAQIDVASPERSTVTATFDVGSFEIREGTGGVRPLTDADRAEIKSTLERKVLDRQRYPRVTFTARSVTVSGARIRLVGDLTIRGQVRPITVDAQVVDGQTHRFSGTATVVQTRWNITPYKGLFGALKVADPVEVHIELALTPGNPTSAPD